MAEIVNLRAARKARARAGAKAAGDANAARFGRSKLEKAVAEAKAAKLKASLDGARREGPSDKD